MGPRSAQEDIPIWGSADEGLAQRLQRAYQDFTSWTRARGIQQLASKYMFQGTIVWYVITLSLSSMSRL